MNTYSINDPRSELPAGTYYIGDPCYVILDEEWSQALEETNYFNLFPSEDACKRNKYNPKNMQNGIFNYRANDTDVRYFFAASSTEYGDGCYRCTLDGCEVGECGVDAGLIAAIPVEMIEKYGEVDGITNGLVLDFTHPFGVRYRDGRISFGDVSVHTGD